MRNQLMIRATIVLALAVLAAALCVPAALASSQDQPAPAKTTLYQRMGGYDNLAGIVGDFLKQLGEDHAFDRFGQGRGKNSLERARQLIVDQVCSLTGGPCIYIGRDMKTAHQGLKITQAEWEAAGQSSEGLAHQVQGRRGGSGRIHGADRKAAARHRGSARRQGGCVSQGQG